jgi:hypothetical protein
VVHFRVITSPRIRNQESGGARVWLPIKYTVDPCQITIKSSREQYTAELHLEIRKIYIESIHLSEADLA